MPLPPPFRFVPVRALVAAVLLTTIPVGVRAQRAASSPGRLGVPAGAAPDSADRPGPSGPSSPAEADGGDRGRLFAPPLADPRQPRVSAALLSTNLLRPNPAPVERPGFSFANPDPERREYQAKVAIGSSIRFFEWHLRPDVRAAVGIEGGVFARFRMESRTNDLVGTDWIVSLPLTVAHGPFSGRLRLLHWSAHLGDEVEAQTGARRINYGYEATDLLFSWRASPSLRLYGGGGADLRSATRTEGTRDARIGRGARLQAGVEVVRHPFHDPRLGWVGGIDWKRSHARLWRDQLAIVTGLERRRGDTRLRLLARAYLGPSQMGEFFLTDEHAFSVELSLLP